MLKHLLLFLLPFFAFAQPAELSQYHPVWTTQSQHSGESMPCGGGDVGLNVWVEEGEVLLYVSRSGTFDENNMFLKMGRVRLQLEPNPFAGETFRQELRLADGSIYLTGNDGTQVHVWVDVFRPVVHVDVASKQPLQAEASYESWRHHDRAVEGKAKNATSYKWAPVEVTTYQDSIDFQGNAVQFYHRNRETTVFDVTVHRQQLDSVKGELFNPLKHLTFGGVLRGRKMEPAGTYTGTYLDTDFQGWRLTSTGATRSHQLELFLHVDQTETQADWQAGLESVVKEAGQVSARKAWTATRDWWHDYWNRSFVFVQPVQANPSDTAWQVGRNYQLFRYLLGCNAFGDVPTKFNGGLFTYDPSLTDSTIRATPDHRNWGGGTMTAQNQRLVYWPMLKSGDWAMMRPQFEFYHRALRNAELRSEVYWGHGGACFTEQLENYGLPNPAEYGWERPADFDPGLQYNAWLEYEWDTVLEFCQMLLETQRYAAQDITEYLPLIESCLRFFDEHYQSLARQRGSKALDGDGHLILYPGSAVETYKMTYNASSTSAALRTVLESLLALPESYLTPEQRTWAEEMATRIPPLAFREVDGHRTIAPAQVWARVNNTEVPQLYPVFPWGIYGVGKPDLEIARNTWAYDPDALKFRSHVGWKQDNIFAARLGLTDEAARLTKLKLGDSGRRFPAFWGPGFDWVPDHNWGGSGMIGLQEMLLQTDGEKIMLLPAWPQDWDVHFKLHAPYQTTVEGMVKDGTLVSLKVLPESRTKDVVNLWEE
ncbi:hypothetical protein SAMN05421823_110159 [Catalinimonas alkaloidigena]|uniref:DUF5703 domain-containing protein n=1 Tax=Catalinimonas alkaloidigena TaxID=1075417 RepID=A0A1G9QG56_9BACT|nr:DUF5703 domain-containing protein [Catalinimonas alkaloidigena]SDM09956.1 hypothetical protein SAMN05421823_110159 [Catalinimonas alkaloidigena]